MAEGGEPLRLRRRAPLHARKLVHDAEHRLPHARERRRLDALRGVRGLVIPRIERGEGRIGEKEGGQTCLDEGEIVAVELHPHRAHRGLVEPGQARIAHDQGRSRGPRPAQGRSYRPRGHHVISARPQRIGVGNGMDRRRPALPSAHLHVDRGHHVAHRRAELLDEGARSRRGAMPRRPRFLSVPGDEDQGPAPRAPREDTRRFDHDAHSPAVVVGAGSAGSAVVVGADHDELGPRSGQLPQHVDAVDAPGVEVLQPHVGEARIAELRGDVLGGGEGARRAPGMRAERGQGGRMAQGGLAVEGRGGEQRGQQRVHAKRRL